MNARTHLLVRRLVASLLALFVVGAAGAPAWAAGISDPQDTASGLDIKAVYEAHDAATVTYATETFAPFTDQQASFKWRLDVDGDGVFELTAFAEWDPDAGGLVGAVDAAGDIPIAVGSVVRVSPTVMALAFPRSVFGGATSVRYVGFAETDLNQDGEMSPGEYDRAPDAGEYVQRLSNSGPVLVAAAAATPAAAPKDVTHRDFDPAAFSHPTAINNQWTPLVPGMQYTFEGEADRGQGRAAHQIVFTVTDVTKVIDGVKSLVMWDRDFQVGQLVEEELTFQAQDDGGNVWNMGEYPEEYEQGLKVGAPNTWIPGQAKAEAGLLMRAQPRENTSSYFQGLSPSIAFKDEARVAKEHQSVCAPVACYQDAVLIDEWNPLEQPQDGHQLKYYAPGVGNVRIDPSGGTEQESLVLTKVAQMGPEAMDEARNAVLALDKRAYGLASSVYSSTPPATVEPAATPAVGAPPAQAVTGAVASAQGYRLVGRDGGIFTFGEASFEGSTGAMHLNSPIVGMTATPGGRGYWLVASDGGVFAFGDAAFEGSTGAQRLNKPIVAMSTTPTGRGYWLLASDGGIFAFGDAKFQGSTGAMKLTSPVVAMASTPTGNGYWLAAADGAVFAFGDAVARGSAGSVAKPVVGMTATADGGGYWLVASDGGIFAFGTASFKGSTGAIKLASPIVGMNSTRAGSGYWLVAADGGIFAFGDAAFLGSTGASRLAGPIVGMAS